MDHVPYSTLVPVFLAPALKVQGHGAMDKV